MARSRRVRIGLVAGLSMVALALPAGMARADTVTADLFTDTSAAPCLPDPNPAPCELRGAVSFARNNGGADTIKLLAGTYALALGPDNGVNSNANGDLDYSDLGPELLGDLTIQGAGAGKTTIDAPPGERIFANFAIGDLVQISGITFTGGNMLAATGDEPDGGAIEIANNSPTTIRDVVITGNHADGNGGGLINYGPGVTLTRVTISNNTTGGAGGGVFSAAALTQPSLTIDSSTINGNESAFGGAGIANFGDGGGGFADPDLTVTNSTIANNRANGYGGGVDTFNQADTTLSSVTVARNTANADNAGAEQGGGLQNGGAGATVDVKNTLVALNQVGTGSTGPDCNGNFSSGNGNVISSTAGTCNGFNGDTVAANPKIGPLSNNGGPTLTVPLLAGSAAINHTTGCSSEDQRGLSRVGRCDSGAYERVPCGKAAVNRFGTDGNDTIVGTGGPDGILGFAGKDVLRGKGGKDGICGGGGRDRLVGGGGRDLLKGQAGRDKLKGGPGRDKLVGGPGLDILIGGPGLDKLRQ